MPKSFEKRLLLYKIETTEGTDSTPIVGTDAILTRNLDASGLEADTKVRQLDGQYFGARPSVLSSIRRPVSFEVEIAGAGVAATIPAWMKLNRICGFDAGASGGGGNQQNPISASIPSATLWPHYDNLRLKALGSRGTFTMTFEDDEIPFFTYNMTGFAPSGMVDESVPGAPTLTGFKDPVLCSTANTTFTLGAYAAPLRRLVINAGSQVEPRSLIGPTDKMMFRNREITFEAVIELPDLTAKNYWTSVEARTTQALQLIHGTVAGNIVQVDGARAELGLPVLSEEQGIVMATIPGRFLPTSAGNDEFLITSK
jgi:hypothetical protein